MAGQAAGAILRGCLSGSPDNYTLTDHNGTVYHLVGASKDLQNSVGHEVQITGTPDSRRTGTPDDFLAWREGLLVELTEAALRVAVQHGMKAPLPEVELDFYQAFRLVLREITWLRWSRSLESVT